MASKPETTASLKRRTAEAWARVDAYESAVYALSTSYDQTVVRVCALSGGGSLAIGAIIGWVGTGTLPGVVLCALTGLCTAVLVTSAVLLGVYHRAVREVLTRAEGQVQVAEGVSEKYDARPIEEKHPDVPIIWGKTSRRAGCYRNGEGGRRQKYRYTDPDKAKAEADRLNARFRIEFAPYECVECDGIHVGRNPVER